jgi:hypothetical protein
VRIADPVDSRVTGEHRGGTVLGTPGKSPRHFETGVLESGTVVEPLVTLFEHGAEGAGVGAPGGVIVDLVPVPAGQTKIFKEYESSSPSYWRATYQPWSFFAFPTRGRISACLKPVSFTRSDRKRAARSRADSVGSVAISRSSLVSGLSVIVIWFSRPLSATSLRLFASPPIVLLALLDSQRQTQTTTQTIGLQGT